MAEPRARFGYLQSCQARVSLLLETPRPHGGVQGSNLGAQGNPLAFSPPKTTFFSSLPYAPASFELLCPGILVRNLSPTLHPEKDRGLCSSPLPPSQPCSWISLREARLRSQELGNVGQAGTVNTVATPIIQRAPGKRAGEIFPLVNRQSKSCCAKPVGGLGPVPRGEFGTPRLNTTRRAPAPWDGLGKRYRISISNPISWRETGSRSCPASVRDNSI